MKIQHLKVWNGTKEVLRGKYVILNVHIKKEKILKSNHLSSHLKNPGKEESNKPRANMRKETMEVVQKSIKQKIGKKTINQGTGSVRRSMKLIRMIKKREDTNDQYED